MAADSRRLSILTASEVDDIYGLPRLTEDDRQLYFELSPAEREALEGVHTTSAAVHFVLQLGYFKAKRRFFVYEHAAVLEDLQHILRRYFPERDLDTYQAFAIDIGCYAHMRKLDGRFRFEDRQDLLGRKSGRMTTHYSAAELENLLQAANRVCGTESRKIPTLVIIKGTAQG